jgi:hypothetical protein
VNRATGPLQASAQPAVTPTQAQCSATTTFLDAYTKTPAGTWTPFASTQDAGRFVTCNTLLCANTGCQFEDSIQFSPSVQTMRFKASGVRSGQGITANVVIADRGFPTCDPQ